MSFTSLHSNPVQQLTLRGNIRLCLALAMKYEQNWHTLSIGRAECGNSHRQYDMPGFCAFVEPLRRYTGGQWQAQNHVNMKNARKDTGVSASDAPQAPKAPLFKPEDQILSETHVFTHKPAPRQPESPEVESLRTLLKANLLREKASPALMERIRSRMHDSFE